MPLVLALPELLTVLAVIAILLIGVGPAVRAGELIAKVVRQIPAIGQQLGDAIVAAIGNLAFQAKAWADGAAKPVTDLVDFVTGTVQSVIRSIAQAVELAHYLAGLLGSGLTALTGAFTYTAAALWARITAQAGAIVQLTLARLALTAQVASILAHAIPAAIYQAVTTAERAAAVALAAASSALHAAIAQAVATGQALVGAEAAARAAADAAVRAAAAAEAAAVARSASAAIAAAEHVIGAEIGTLGQAIDGVAAKIGPLAYPTVALAVAAVTTEIETLRRECIDPTCGYLGPQLGFLNAIADVAVLGLLAEVIATAAKDPQAAARETVGAASFLVGAGTGLFAELTGVH